MVSLDVNQVGLDRLTGESQGDGHVVIFLVQITDVADPAACEQDLTREPNGNVHILIDNADLGMGVIHRKYMVDLVKTATSEKPRGDIATRTSSREISASRSISGLLISAENVMAPERSHLALLG